MRRRLLILDLLLLVGAAGLGREVRARWLEARKREQLAFQQRLQPLPPPPYAPLPPVERVNAIAYLEVAQKLLFSPERNPNVVVEVPKPKPMPPFPVAHGVMNLGQGPLAILSEKSGAPHRGYQAGEQIGEFKLLAVGSDAIVLEWEGQQINKRIEELMDRKAVAEAPAETSRPAAPSTAATVVSTTPAGPGAPLGDELRACQPGDTSPAGTVTGGYRKLVTRNPFGEFCRWEPVK